MQSPVDRIVWELEQFQHRERMAVMENVLEHMGMAAPGRPGSVSNTRRWWVSLGAMALGAAFGIGLWITMLLSGRLELTLEPVGASVSIDGVEHDPSRWPIQLKPGLHTLSVTSPGYERSVQDIVVGADRTLRVSVKLEGLPDTGLEITSEPPGMQVWIDGERLMGQSGPPLTNLRAGRIPPGRHTLELKGDDRAPSYWRQAVTIEPGRLTRVHAVMAPFPGGTF